MHVLLDNHIISYKLQFVASATEVSLKSIGLKSIMTTSQQRWPAEESGGGWISGTNRYVLLTTASQCGFPLVFFESSDFNDK